MDNSPIRLCLHSSFKLRKLLIRKPGSREGQFLKKYLNPGRRDGVSYRRSRLKAPNKNIYRHPIAQNHNRPKFIKNKK